MYIEWTQDLSVGNDQIDKEHQRWIEILNDFYVGLKEGKSSEKLQELILAMLDYTKYHFANEESYMKQIHYPKLAQHQKLHREYVEKIESFHEKIKAGRLLLTIEVTNFLKTWLINHIKGVDHGYMRFNLNQD
ncbi:bacteriohemerythrin [Geofilum sp. OHC36d9]|uniref:bacteriohemerythrin n=1 Tax=Geofilum sp. OHC36d9 TaxID=3458413 RepID=UPI004033FA85